MGFRRWKVYLREVEIRIVFGNEQRMMRSTRMRYVIQLWHFYRFFFLLIHVLQTNAS